MRISKIAAQKALRRRQAEQVRELELDPAFPKQNAFVLDTNRFIAAQCTRRAGKTNGLALRFFKTMEKYPGSQCIYLALTRESALNIMWPVLQELNDKYKLGCRFLESKLTLIHPNGARLRLLGADQKQFAKRLKGIKSPGIAIDEAQEFGTHLQSLIDDVLTPTMTDYADSWLAVTGTPGPVPIGYFFDVTQNNKYGYVLHKWSLFDNPYLPDARTFVSELKRKRGWGETNATLRREWYNEWVLDVDSLWIRYKEETNNYNFLPSDKYHYILGIDLGYNDADALAVIAWSEKSPVTYLVEEIIEPKQGVTELVDQINKVCTRYNIDKMVIDEGGLGKKLAEEIRRRHGIPVQPADKLRKQETVEFLNDALRQGRFKAKSYSRFASDSYLVQIDWEHSTPNRIVVKKKPHSDIIDAVIYAFKESPSYTYQAEIAKPARGSKEWGTAEETRMFEAELEKAKEEQEQENRRWGNSDDGDFF